MENYVSGMSLWRGRILNSFLSHSLAPQTACGPTGVHVLIEYSMFEFYI